MHVKTMVKGVTYAPGASKFNSLLEVRITADDIGKSLSIADPDANIMLVVPLEPLARYLRIKEVKK